MFECEKLKHMNGVERISMRNLTDFFSKSNAYNVRNWAANMAAICHSRKVSWLMMIFQEIHWDQGPIWSLLNFIVFEAYFIINGMFCWEVTTEYWKENNLSAIVNGLKLTDDFKARFIDTIIDDDWSKIECFND